RMIVSRADGNLIFFTTGSSQVMMQALLAGSWKVITTPPGSVPPNVWSHVAATYDGAQLRLYVNGTNVVSLAGTGSLPSTTSPYRIGSPNNVFAGPIDEVRFYARALSAAEVRLDEVTPIDTSTPFQVSAVTPLDHAMGVLTSPITAGFTRDADAATVSSSTIELRDNANALVPATV